MTGRSLGALGATVRYEALLSFRHRAVWLSLLPLVALIMVLGEFPYGRNRTSDIAAVGETALLINFLGSLGIAIVLADRLAGQRRPGLRELFGATPAGGLARTAGLILGPWLIASVPATVVLVSMGGWLAITSGGPGPLGAAVIGVLTVVAPGSLLLTMLANVAALLLPSAVARVLLVPFWYWATLLTPLLPIPTPARTVLSPVGDYQAAQWLEVALPGRTGGWLYPAVSVTSSILACGLTLAVTVLAFFIGHAITTKGR
ncbi:hypothetical protein [Nocardia brasiliensis]|uniref:hypothetical protein n=1 Tax=Nocardia brasiliensis TaxID=37326 RepID=UPI002454669D|nr:hypothetical protein [Nocardia brasiliensis]